MPTGPDAAVRLAAAYSALMRGILYPGSESDTPYEPFSAPLDPPERVSAASFRAAAGLAPWWDVRVDPLGDWFDAKIAAVDESGESPEVAVAYGLLRRAMTATLDGALRQASAADPPGGAFHKTRRYVFGRVPGGGLAGLVARSVET